MAVVQGPEPVFQSHILLNVSSSQKYNGRLSEAIDH